jgi:hypothetical protein
LVSTAVCQYCQNIFILLRCDLTTYKNTIMEIFPPQKSQSYWKFKLDHKIHEMVLPSIHKVAIMSQYKS